MTNSSETARAAIVEMFRRDLVGPLPTDVAPGDADLQTERLAEATATVRRAQGQIRALFDRAETQVFPPPGIERTDSWFAKTVPSSESPALRSD